MNIFSNFFKKEAPLLGLQGSGGGLGFLAGSGPSELSATGGTEITNGNVKYHVFITDQNFVVSGQGNIELLVVGGGGAATGPYSAGGGAGGIAHGPSVPIGPGTYPVVVGTRGLATATATGSSSSPGRDSSITLPIGTITGLGGGSGTQDSYQVGPAQYNPGGCGGGNADDSSPNSGDATQPLQPNFGIGVNQYGEPGFGPPSGNAPGNTADGGGGGGCGTGGGSSHSDSKTGGNGRPFSNFPAPVLAPAIPGSDQPGWTPAVGPTGLFGGGGNGARGPSSRPPGGGGAVGGNGVNYTGGGGGGNHNNGPRGSGGHGIVIIRYLLPS